MGYIKARDGDSIIVPFECDLYMFRKLRRENQVTSNTQEKLLLEYIRQMYVYVFWSRSTSTITCNRNKTRKMLSLSSTVGLKCAFVHDETFPNFDRFGYEVAIPMLIYSKNTGRLHSDHLKYDTILKFHSTFGNQVRASPQATSETLFLLDEKVSYTRLVRNPCGSMWFHKFLEGCSKRTGQY